MTLEERFDALMRQHELMLGESLVPPNRPNLNPMSIKRHSKCQGFGHMPLDCPNKEFITLAEWEAAMEEENEAKSEDERDQELEETQEEVMEEATEGELLVLRRVPSQRKGVKDEPSNPSPTHPITKTLKQNFCQSILEPLLQTPNSKLRAFGEMVQSTFEESPRTPFKSARGMQE